MILKLSVLLLIQGIEASHLLHWSNCVQKHWDHDKTKCTGQYDDLECMDKVSVIGEQNCIDGYKTHIDVCCRKDDKVCSFSCVPPEADELITETPLKRNELIKLMGDEAKKNTPQKLTETQKKELLTIVKLQIKEHDERLKESFIEMKNTAHGQGTIIMATIAAILAIFLIQVCAIIAYVRQQKKDRKLLYINYPEDIEDQKSSLVQLPSDTKQQPQNLSLNESQSINDGVKLVSFASKDMINDRFDKNDTAVYKVEVPPIPEVIKEEQKIVRFNTPNEMEQTPIIVKNTDEDIQCPQDVKFDRDEWFQNKMELKEMERSIQRRKSSNRERTNSNRSFGMTDRSKNEASNLNMSLTGSQDPSSLSRNFMSPNIHENKSKTPLMLESKLTTKTVSLQDSLNLDLTKVHKIKQAEQDIIIREENLVPQMQLKSDSPQHTSELNSFRSTNNNTVKITDVQPKFRLTQLPKTYEFPSIASSPKDNSKPTEVLIQKPTNNQDSDTSHLYAAQMIADRPLLSRQTLSSRQPQTVQSSRRGTSHTPGSQPSLSKMLFIKKVYNQNLRNPAMVGKKNQKQDSHISSPRQMDRSPRDNHLSPRRTSHYEDYSHEMGKTTPIGMEHRFFRNSSLPPSVPIKQNQDENMPIQISNEYDRRSIESLENVVNKIVNDKNKYQV